MHRCRATIFASTPIRCTPDDESIELDDMSLSEVTDTETSEDESCDEDDDIPKSYALEYALMTLEAAHLAVCESFAEAAENSAGSTSKFERFADKANNVIAAPFAYCPALLIAILGFLSGAALDIHTAIMRKLRENKPNTLKPHQRP